MEDNTLKKVAIVTIMSINFGNRLQNYALQNVLQKMNFSVTTLKRCEEKKGLKTVLKTIIQILLQTKGSKFRNFNKKIKLAKECVSANICPPNLCDKYDYFIVGSDQVWNPLYDFVGTTDLLAFAKPEQRISYAASFGVNNIPEEKRKKYAENLTQFKAISVREESGVKIVKELTGRDVQTVLDPTMLLTSEQWSKLEKNSKFSLKKRYVLVYSLGEKSTKFENSIKHYAKEMEILDIRKKQKNGREIPIGPAEFLNLIHNAELVLTDSFHASVFSILYHKRFMTFKRPGIDMSSRMVSLAIIIGAKDKLDTDNNLDCSNGLNYVLVDQLIERERKQSIDFLKEVLED